MKTIMKGGETEKNNIHVTRGNLNQHSHETDLNYSTPEKYQNE